MKFWMVCIFPEVAMLKILLKSFEFKSIKNSLKSNGISIVLAGVDDDLDVPDWGWCP